MSWDNSIIRAACPTCGRGDAQDADEINLTFNLSKMLHAAGFIGWRVLDGLPANAAGVHIIAVLDAMAMNATRWRALNPVNGWGDYDTCLQDRLRAWALRCIAAGPDDTISCHG